MSCKKIRIRAEVNKTKAKRATQRLTKMKSCFFQKRINKMDKFLCEPSKGKKTKPIKL